MSNVEDNFAYAMEGNGACKAGEEVRAAILRFEDVPATPKNLARMRERVQDWNRRLAESGVPFRLRLM